jgi:hypothetical protein
MRSPNYPVRVMVEFPSINIACQYLRIADAPDGELAVVAYPKPPKSWDPAMSKIRPAMKADKNGKASHRLEKAFTFGGKDHSLTFKFIQVRK